MRNFKKLLALVLALVMSLSLVAVANAADFTDVASNADHAEAIDVMSAIGVINGYTDGSFKPDGTLTRAEGAKIVAYMLLGDAVEGLPASAPFTDVPATHWAAAPIAYLKGQGIVNGRTATTFDPSATLNGYEFAKMLLVALGYDAQQEGLTGKGYSINAAKLATVAGLNQDVTISAAAINRGSAAQMAFNTLTADMVDYEGGVNVNTADGTQVNVDAVRYKAEGSKVAGANYDGATGDGIMQFCEQYFPKLTKAATGKTDAFGAPGHDWNLNNKKAAGTYANTPIAVYTKGMTETADVNQITSDLAGYDDATFTKLKTIRPIVNGAPGNALSNGINTNTTDNVVALTGNGKVVSVYAAGTTLSSVIVESYDLYKVSLVNTAGNSLTLTKVTNGDGANSVTVTKDDSAANKDFYAELSGLAKDDYVLMATKQSDSTILATAKYTTAEGAYTASTSSTVTVGGTAYTTAKNNTVTMTMSATSDYTLYLDQFGYAIYAESKTTDSNTAYILHTAKDGSARNGYEYSAQLLLTDGTVQWVSVGSVKNSGKDIVPGSTQDSSNAEANKFAADKDSDNGGYNDMFVTYTVNADGSYKLGAPAKAKDGISKITSGDPTLSSTITANSKTVFLVKQSDGTYKAYTGIKNVPNVTTATAVADDVIAKVVVVTAGSVSGTENKYVYLYDSTPTKTAVNGSDTVYTYNAIVDGVKTTVDTVLAPSAVTGTNGAKLGLYMNCTTDGEGRISALPANELGASQYGVKGNISVTYGSTPIELSLKDGVLTVKAGSTDVKVATDATTSDNAESKAITVAEGFTAYKITEGAGSTGDGAAKAEYFAIGETSEITKTLSSGSVFITVNSDGEATALFAILKQATATG